jgi:hypothetical protein
LGVLNEGHVGVPPRIVRGWSPSLSRSMIFSSFPGPKFGNIGCTCNSPKLRANACYCCGVTHWFRKKMKVKPLQTGS